IRTAEGFTVSSVSPGSYEICIRDPNPPFSGGLVVADLTVQVAEGQRKEVTVDLRSQARAHLLGRATVAGKPAGDVVLCCVWDDDTLADSAQRVKGDGSIDVLVAPRPSVVLEAWTPLNMMWGIRQGIRVGRSGAVALPPGGAANVEIPME